MGCFCHAALTPLSTALPQLHLSASVGMPALPGADIPLALSAWLSARGMPAAPWQPDPNWLALPLPRMQLGLRAVATISALAQLRAQVMSQFGIDLLVPAQARAFTRIVATLNARLSALASLQQPPMANFNPLAWIQLATLNNAIDQVQLALQAGLLAPPPSLMLALTMPGGMPMARWTSFLAQLRAVAPMIAATAQLNVSLSETAQLSAALRPLIRLALPPLVAPQLMASLTAALMAVAQLQASLGLSQSPLVVGLPQLMLRVQAKLGALLAALSSQFGITLNAAGLVAELVQALLALLPNLPALPTSLATPAVVQAALQANAMAALNWQVPAMLPAVQVGLPAASFAAQLHAALGINPVLPAPCSSGCDAAKLMQALESAA